MANAKKGDLVKIHQIILRPDERSDALPECSKAVPYEGWIKGFLTKKEAKIGDEVTVETFAGREISGTLCEVNPVYDHDFGVPTRELLCIGKEARKVLSRGRWD
jgi:hypothetical protein